MNKSFFYYFGYTTAALDWKSVFMRAASTVVYNDAVIDRVLNAAAQADRPIRDDADTNQSEGSDRASTSSDSVQHPPTDQAADQTVDQTADTRRFYIITNEKIAHTDITYTNDYISTQEIENIILANKLIYVKGFLFIRRRKCLITQMVNSACDNDFNETSTKLGLDTWKYEFYHKKFLFNKMNRLVSKTTLNTVYEIKRDHPLILFFQDFLRSCFKVINKRVFSIIIIGNTKIGKSICFKECLIDSRYIEYHNNMLEFSKCTDENKKLFRLMDDINWNTVDVMTLKSILNRNVSSVDVKYSYGIIYPMINIFLMNKEDYAIFQRKYVDIWSFISNNVAIYPRQTEKEITEETVQLYDQNSDLTTLLFRDIMDIAQHEVDFDSQIKAGVYPNIYECIKAFLINDQPYIYDNRQFLDISTIDINMLPNRQLIVNEMTQRIREVETEEKYNQKVKSRSEHDSGHDNSTSDSESEESEDNSRIDPQFNRKGCLDYYFKRHAKKRHEGRKERRLSDGMRAHAASSNARHRKQGYSKPVFKPRNMDYMDNIDDMDPYDKYSDMDNDMDNNIDNDFDNDMDMDNDSDDIMDASFNV